MKTKIFNFIQNLLFVLSIVICVFILAQKFVFKKDGIFGYRTFVIVTSSMSPNLEVGDVILVKKVEPKTIKEGDIVTYQGLESDFKGKTVTHMVKTVDVSDTGEYLFYTKGTVTNMIDPVVKGSQIYGKLVYRMFLISLVSKIIRSKIGFVILVFIPLIIILIKQLSNIKHEIKPNGLTSEEIQLLNDYKNKNKKKFSLFKTKKPDNMVVEIKNKNEELEKTIYSREFKEEIDRELEKTIISDDLRNEIMKYKEEKKVSTPSRGLENTLINSKLSDEIKEYSEKVADIIIIED